MDMYAMLSVPSVLFVCILIAWVGSARRERMLRHENMDLRARLSILPILLRDATPEQLSKTEARLVHYFMDSVSVGAANARALVSDEVWARQAECTPRLWPGQEVIDSGNGPGRITEITSAGFPKVEGIAVSWCCFDDGSMFDPFGHVSGPRPARQKGFTLIELMIVIAIIAILAVVGQAMYNGKGGTLSWGVNGVTEERCIAGHVHVVGQDGNARQVFGARGTGIPCEPPKK